MTKRCASASCRVRKSLTWSIDSIPLSTGEDITCILCIKLILGQLNYNKLQRSPLQRDHFKCNMEYIDSIYAFSLLMPRDAAQENWNSCSHQPAWSRRQGRIKEKPLASFITNDVCWYLSIGGFYHIKRSWFLHRNKWCCSSYIYYIIYIIYLYIYI